MGILGHLMILLGLTRMSSRWEKQQASSCADNWVRTMTCHNIRHHPGVEGLGESKGAHNLTAYVQICVSTGKARGGKCRFRCHLLACWQRFRNFQELSLYTKKCLDADQDHRQTVEVDQRLLKRKTPSLVFYQALTTHSSLFSNPDWSTLSQSNHGP